MAKGLHRVSAGKALDINKTTWNEIRSIFESGMGVDVNGVSGDLNYAEDTEETAGAGELWQIILDGGVLKYNILG